MKKLQIISILTTLLFSANSGAQNTNLSFSGFVKNDFYFDSRIQETSREGIMSFYPKAVSKDINGKDINDMSSFNIQTIQTRLRCDFKTADVLDAKVSGAVESEFYGVSNADVNGIRMRHAYGKLNWTHVELLAGQTWHPFFVPETAPNTLVYNSGIPFQPLSRNPQIRLTYSTGNFKVFGTILSERDFTSVGLTGNASANNDYIRNAGVPACDLQLQLTADSGRIFVGAGVDYFRIKPEIMNSKTFKNKAGKDSTVTNVTDEQVKSLSYTLYAKYENSDFYARLQASLLENGFSLSGIGGYAATYVDSGKMFRKYTPLRTVAYKADFMYKIGDIKLGMLLGYTENLGTDKKIVGKNIFSRDANLDYLYRISPRITYTKSKCTLGFELEYTAAFFGTPDNKAVIEKSDKVENIRPFLSFIYSF